MHNFINQITIIIVTIINIHYSLILPKIIALICMSIFTAKIELLVDLSKFFLSWKLWNAIWTCFVHLFNFYKIELTALFILCWRNNSRRASWMASQSFASDMICLLSSSTAGSERRSTNVAIESSALLRPQPDFKVKKINVYINKNYLQTRVILKRIESMKRSYNCD